MTEINEAMQDPGAVPGLSSRSLVRKHAAVVLTLILFVAGSYALYRLLAPLSMIHVLASLRATPVHVYIGAIAATVTGYLALVGYDWSALQYIGKRLPLRTVALGGFLGYAFGNTIGLSAISGGAVRYRIYSALGLDAFDVAAISSFAAIAYGIGTTLIGMCALIAYPDSLHGFSHLAPATLRLWSIVGLVTIVGLLIAAALRGGALTLGRFSLKAPSVIDLGRQMVFTFTEILMGSLVLYIYLPGDSVPYANLLVVYAIATMVGVASHVPGGVGVFESVVISALPDTVALDDAVTALLLFRLTYFLLPFVAALASLSLVEVWAAGKRRSPSFRGLAPVLEASRAIVPTATGFLALASGLFMMFAGLLPHPSATADELETILPLAMIEGGALVSSILGAFLVILSMALFRRSRQAYWILFCLLAVGVLTAGFKTQDLDRVLLISLFLVILVPYRVEFNRTAHIAQGLFSVQWVGMVLATFAALGLTWLLVHENSAASDWSWWQIFDNPAALTAGRAGIAAAVVLSLALLASALKTGRIRMVEPDPTALGEAQAIIERYGSGGDMLALTGDKMLMFDASSDAVLSYAVKGASWIALGAPVGGALSRRDLAWAFHDAARAAGARPVFYEAPLAFAETSAELGLTLHKMGEEAVVPLDGFTLDGSSRKKLRTTFNRALRDGLSLDMLVPPHSATDIARLKAISDEWLSGHAAREKRFSVGRFDPGWLGRCRIAVVRHEGEIVAFINLMEAEASGSVAVDLMRQVTDSPANTMEFLFTSLMLRLKEDGFHELSLGMVPFAGVGGARRSDLWSHFGALIYLHGDKFYNFDGLRRFKAKFDPEWRPRYLCCRTVLPPVAPLADAARLIAGSARGIVGK